jgi:hypothetical protein
MVQQQLLVDQDQFALVVNQCCAHHQILTPVVIQDRVAAQM